MMKQYHSPEFHLTPDISNILMTSDLEMDMTDQYDALEEELAE